MQKAASGNGSIVHGSAELPAVSVVSYSLEIEDEEGFIGDRANNSAFIEKLEALRKLWRKDGEDPLGEAQTDELKKKQIDNALVGGDPAASALIHGAIEAFAKELAAIIRRFMRTQAWKKTQRIAIGGGFKGSRTGEVTIARTAALLKEGGHSIDLVPVRHHPDEAGLIGAVHLIPPWTLAGHDAILAVDIGGSNIRAGLVLPQLDKAGDFSKAQVHKVELWRHAEASPSRTDSVAKLVAMLRTMIETAEKKQFALAPFIGIGCPGRIAADGSIVRGGQNLPGGNWSSSHFNLPEGIVKAIGSIGGHPPQIVMHNDAVVQGLSQLPFMQDVKRWSVLTIGTGLGNGCFVNRPAPPAS